MPKYTFFLFFFCSSTSGKSKKRKSLVISNPIPCNTAFPADHVSIHSTSENAKDVSSTPVKKTQSISEETSAPEEGSVSSKDVNSSDSDLSSGSSNTPKRQSVCDNESSDGGSGSHGPEDEEAEAKAEAEAEAEAELEVEAEEEQATSQSDDSGVEALKSEAASQEVSNPSDSADSEAAQSPEPENVSDPPSEEAKPKTAPVPAPRVSFRSTDRRPLLKAAKVEKEEMAANQEAEPDPGEDSSTHNPPGFLYKVHSPVRHYHLKRESLRCW